MSHRFSVNQQPILYECCSNTNLRPLRGEMPGSGFWNRERLYVAAACICTGLCRAPTRAVAAHTCACVVERACLSSMWMKQCVERTAHLGCNSTHACANTSNSPSHTAHIALLAGSFVAAEIRQAPAGEGLPQKVCPRAALVCLAGCADAQSCARRTDRDARPWPHCAPYPRGTQAGATTSYC